MSFPSLPLQTALGCSCLRKVFAMPLGGGGRLVSTDVWGEPICGAMVWPRTDGGGVLELDGRRWLSLWTGRDGAAQTVSVRPVCPYGGRVEV